MWHMRFGPLESAPRYVHIMAGLYLVMLALFLRIQLLQLPVLKRAVEAERWPDGGAVLGQIRRLVGINLVLGLLVIALASVRPSRSAARRLGKGWFRTCSSRWAPYQ